MPKHWLLGGWDLRRLIIHQQWYRPSDSNKYVYIKFSAHDAFHQVCSISNYWRARAAQWVRSLALATHTSLSPIRRGFAPVFVNYKKWCTRLAAASDKVYQLLIHGRRISLGTPASSIIKTGSNDIAEILLKVALSTKKSNSFQISESQIEVPMSNKPKGSKRDSQNRQISPIKKTIYYCL